MGESYVERVAQKTTEIRAGRLLLSVVALPFFVLGFVVGVLWVALKWCFAALLVGFSDGVTRRQASPAAVPVEGGGDVAG